MGDWGLGYARIGRYRAPSPSQRVPCWCHDGTVAYFTAVIAHTGRSWKARDVEVDEATSLDDLAAALRSVSIDDRPVLAVIEHEDEWFALVRVDGEDEPRLFVSDFGASSRCHYGELLASAADVDVDAGDPSAATDDEERGEDDDASAVAWAGDLEILDDLGVGPRELRKVTEESGDDPGSVLADLGEAVGFADLLEVLR
jgi:putative tRNA adenosine deaminase-associated protein